MISTPMEKDAMFTDGKYEICRLSGVAALCLYIYIYMYIDVFIFIYISVPVNPRHLDCAIGSCSSLHGA